MFKISKFNKFLEEVELTIPELDKVDKESKPRGNVLVKKIKNNEPLTTINNKEVIIDKMKDTNDEWVEPEEAIDNITKNGDYDNEKSNKYFKKGRNYKKVFHDDETNTDFQLNQFKKTKDFGSSGAGNTTRESESIQCIFLGIKQAFPNILISPTNIKNYFLKYKEMYEINSFVKLNSDINITESIFDKYLGDKDWTSTFYRIPNRLWSGQSYLNSNEKYLIYHVGNKDSDSIFNILNSIFRKISKSNGFGNIDITKWCPADVYLISIDSKNDIINDIRNVSSLEELNSIINIHFDNKKLIPLSLKKVNKDSNFKIITNNEIDKDLPEFEITSFIINDDILKGISSKIATKSTWKYKNNKDVDIKSRILNLDSSNTKNLQNIDGEVEGSSSRHGKVSLNAIINFIKSRCKEMRFQEMNDYKYYKNFDISELTNIANILYSKITNGNWKLEVKPCSRCRDISNDKNKIISKIQSLQLILILTEIDRKDPIISNEIITSILRYALSIKTDSFDTPRYLRVI